MLSHLHTSIYPYYTRNIPLPSSLARTTRDSWTLNKPFPSTIEWMQMHPSLLNRQDRAIQERIEGVRIFWRFLDITQQIGYK